MQKDVAFLVKKNITNKEIMDVIKKSGGRLLTDIQVFDLYEGDKIGSDEKSIAYNLKFEDASKTLTEEEVMIVFNKIAINITAASMTSPIAYAAIAAINNRQIKTSINCSKNNNIGLLGFFSLISLSPYFFCLFITSESFNPS